MPRPGPTDTVPAMLTPGEAVLNKEAAALVGRDTIKAANQKGLEMRKQVQGYENGVDLVPEENGSETETLQMGGMRSLSGLPGTTQSRAQMANTAFAHGAVAQTEFARNQAADQFGAQTGYKPGTAMAAEETVNPVSETGAVATSPTALQAPGVGTSIPGVQRVGNSYSKIGSGIATMPKIANTTGVQSAIGTVTQPTTSPLMRGFSSSKVPGVQRVGNSYSKSAFQGYADGTEEVPDTKKLIERTTGVDKGTVRPSVPLPADQAAAQAAANAPHGPVQPFESMSQTSSGIYKRKPSSMKQLVPTGGGSIPTVKEPVSVKEGFFTEPKPAQPNFTAQPSYEGTIPPNKQVSVAPKAARVDPFTGEVIGEGSTFATKAKSALGGTVNKAATTVGKVLSGVPLQAAAADYENQQALKENLAAGDAGFGTKARMLASMATRAPQAIAEAITGKTAAPESDSLGGRVVKALTPEATQPKKELPQGAPLENGASVGNPDQELEMPKHNLGSVGPAPGSQEAPITEFSGNGVNLAQGSGKQDKRGIFGANTKEKSEALQRTIDYNAKPETQAMFAREAQIVADRKAKSDASFAADRGTQMQQPQFVQGDDVNPNDEFRSQLENTVLNRGPSSRMSVGEFAAAKHKRAAALGILAGLDARENAQNQSKQNAQKLALEAQLASTNTGLKQQELAQGQKNIEATNASTAAQQAYNRQHQAATEAEAKRANDIREQAEANRPHKTNYLGEDIQGTPTEIEEQKRNIRSTKDSAWDDKNGTPGMFTNTEDFYKKRAADLGYDPDVARAKASASDIQRHLANPKLDKSVKTDIISKYKEQYGVPYTTFLPTE